MGDYATTAPFEAFAAGLEAGHPTDLAGLCGARLVSVAETERDRAWAVSRIKAIMGGDMISAWFVRNDFFADRPTGKLLIAGNYHPRLTRAQTPPLLKGLLFGPDGSAFLPTHTRKGDRI
jgi:putative DNA primase/helicase